MDSKISRLNERRTVYPNANGDRLLRFNHDAMLAIDLALDATPLGPTTPKSSPHGRGQMV